MEISSDQRPLIVLDPILLWSISVLPMRFSEADARSLWNKEPEAAKRSGELWTLLVEEELVIDICCNGPLMERERRWHRYGWEEAFAFQEATRSYPFVQMDTAEGFREDARRMTHYRDEGEPPSRYSVSSNTACVPLRNWADTDLLRASSPESADLGIVSNCDALALILDYCAGERASLDLGPQGTVLLKSVPSGGARHPTEIYIFIFEGFGDIVPGGYHYRVDEHALELLAREDFYAGCREATFDLFDKFDHAPIALVMFASHVERAMWRYRDSRSARAPLVDVGHVLMAFRTAVRGAGLKSYTYQKFQELALCRMLEIDPLAQPPLFVGVLV